MATKPLTFTLDSTPPALSLTLASARPSATPWTDTIYYGEGSGSFTVTATAADTLAGLDTVVFPTTVEAAQSYSQSGVTAVTQAHRYDFEAALLTSATPSR